MVDPTRAGKGAPALVPASADAFQGLWPGDTRGRGSAGWRCACNDARAVGFGVLAEPVLSDITVAAWRLAFGSFRGCGFASAA